MEDCNREVFEKGSAVVVLDACMHRAEEWVKSVAKESGQRVDWHYSGGRANVLYLGDYNKVMAAVEKLAPELDKPMPKTADQTCRCSGNMHGACRILSSYGAGAHGELWRACDP